MQLKLHIKITGIDKFGQPEPVIEFEANSLVRQFIDWINCNFCGSAETIKDTGNTNRSLTQVYLSMNAGSGDSTYGIQVGTGSSAVTVSDYVLGALIAHGNTSGLLSYGTMTYDTTTTISGSTAYFRLYRTFTNNSGAAIEVKELGLVGISSSNYKFLVDRTLNTFTINNGSSKTITYKLSVTV